MGGASAWAISHSSARIRVNGVSAMHTELMRKTVFRDLHALYPDRIVNKTNGITFRRWLHQANPALTRCLRDAAATQFSMIPALDANGFATGATIPADRFAAVARANKIGACCGHSQIGLAISRIPTPCSTSRSSASMNTNGNCSTSSRQSPSTTRSERSPKRNWRHASRSSLAKRQRATAGQTHHQAHQRRRKGHKQRSDVQRPAQVVFMPELQCQPGRSDHSRCRPVRTDLDRRAWKPPEPAT